MENYIYINNQKIELTDEQVKQIMGAYNQRKQLSEYAAGDTVKICGFEMVILEQGDGQTALILKGMYGEDSEFGEKNNNYDGSYVDKKCQQFAQELAEIVGGENIVLHKVDLTSDDGLKDYGEVERRSSLITADMYRKFVEILDTVNPEAWWWLATAHSTKRYENDAWAKCASPSGCISINYYNYDIGVRPFCILKSDIFVSN